MKRLLEFTERNPNGNYLRISARFTDEKFFFSEKIADNLERNSAQMFDFMKNVEILRKCLQNIGGK